MAGGGKTMGMILIAVGVSILLLVAAFLGSGLASGDLGVSGAILGISLFGALPMLIFVGAGIFLLVKGRAEAADMDRVRQQERLLGLIQARGQVAMPTVMLEMKMSREDLSNAIYELVNLGLFAGYIDWEAQTFYSSDASQVGSNKCPNCGGVRELVGKGIVRCPYCGVELFIPSNAAQTVATATPPPGQTASS